MKVRDRTRLTSIHGNPQCRRKTRRRYGQPGSEGVKAGGKAWVGVEGHHTALERRSDLGADLLHAA